jgi:cell wall-associated NlpC family hydrolase
VTSNRLRSTGARLAIATATLLAGGLLTEAVGTAPSAHAAAFPLGSGMDPAVGHADAALTALAGGDTTGYQSALTSLAGEIGPRVGVDPATFVTAWSSAGNGQMTAMLSALTQLGVKYRYASSSPGAAFDCSGLVKWAWSQAGVGLASNSGAIIRSMDNTPVDQLEPGDVVWYPGHVMLSLGVGNTIVHAVSSGKPLKVDQVAGRKLNKLRAIDPLG